MFEHILFLSHVSAQSDSYVVGNIRISSVCQELLHQRKFVLNDGCEKQLLVHRLRLKTTKPKQQSLKASEKPRPETASSDNHTPVSVTP